MDRRETRPIAISRVLRAFSDGPIDRPIDRPTHRPTDQQCGLQSRVHATKNEFRNFVTTSLVYYYRIHLNQICSCRIITAQTTRFLLLFLFQGFQGFCELVSSLLRRKKEKFNCRKNRVHAKTCSWKLHFWIQDFFLFIMVLFFLWKSEEMTWFIFYSITSQSCSKKNFFFT